MLIFISYFLSIFITINSVTDLPEMNMNTNEIIQYYGYPCEIHNVTTEDGYILVLHRITRGLENNSKLKSPVVLLQHGLLDSSFTWVANGPLKSLGFVLNDNGFDVWLGNTRGNVYSNNHTKHLSSSKIFWDFTWDDMAKYDLTAMINYILKVTKSKKLSYIGHSQGAEIGFAKFSQNSTINSKVSSFISLAPAIFLGNMKSKIKHFAGLAGIFNFLLNIIFNGKFLLINELFKVMGQIFCGNNISNVICANVLFLCYGMGNDNINYTRIPIYLNHVPAGTSFANIAHYAQSYFSNEFQMYDYGMLENIEKYQQETPPKYQLEDIGLPIAIFYGGNDWLTVPEDVKRAIDILGESVKFSKLIPDYNHIDFLWGKTLDTLLFPDIINFLNKYKSR